MWRCATVITDYFQNENIFPAEHFKGKKVVEVGAGTGLTGIALGKIGAFVTLTDQKELIPLMEENVLLNSLTECVSVAELSWYSSCLHLINRRGLTDCSQFTTPPIDYILAVECIYLEDLFDPLLQSMFDLCSDETQIIVAFMKRRKADKSFWKKASKRFEWRKVNLKLNLLTKGSLHRFYQHQT